jgi:predicted alpha-1,6-mannanase (GH76 family)
MSSSPKGSKESVSKHHSSTVRQIKKFGMNTTVRLLEERWPTSILTGLDPRKLTRAVCFKNAKILDCCVDAGNRRHKREDRQGACQDSTAQPHT